MLMTLWQLAWVIYEHEAEEINCYTGELRQLEIEALCRKLTQKGKAIRNHEKTIEFTLSAWPFDSFKNLSFEEQIDDSWRYWVVEDRPVFMEKKMQMFDNKLYAFRVFQDKKTPLKQLLLIDLKQMKIIAKNF